MRSLGIVVTLICSASLASPGHALDFNLGADNRTVFASGVIDGDAATRFAAFVSASRLDNATGITVVLNSPGGRLRGGLGLGNAIRAKQWNTLVGRGVAPFWSSTTIHSGTCSSACTLAFLGGATRQLAEGSRVGVHQFSTPDENQRTSETYISVQSTLSLVMNYVRKMGADVQVVEAAAAVRPDKIRFLTESELMAWRVTTPTNTIATGSLPAPSSRTPFVDLPTPARQPPPSSPEAVQPVCPYPSGPLEVIGVADWDHLNVRSTPRTPRPEEQSNVVGRLANGTRGISLSDDCSLSEWCRIQVGCVQGYVGKKFLARSSRPPPTATPGQVAGSQSIGYFFVRDVVQGDVLNVRETPSAASAVVTSIPFNETRIEVARCGRTKSEGAWCFVTYMGHRGWAHAAYLLSTGQRQPPPIDLDLSPR